MIIADNNKDAMKEQTLSRCLIQNFYHSHDIDMLGFSFKFWFKCFPLFLDMVMYDNEFEQ